ncbi:MAG TPA: helix-turn-helix domain-containing protein [Rhodospirillaceae bacterium]|nr:helix-turn-helix domain-containing protein [Rhodospirillaceae bacterium]
MIWEAVLRGSALVWFAQGAMTLVDRMFAEELLPHRIYGSEEAARLLGVERLEVLRLIQNDKIKAQKVDGNFRILGSNLLEYMGK